MMMTTTRGNPMNFYLARGRLLLFWKKNTTLSLSFSACRERWRERPGDGTRAKQLSAPLLQFFVFFVFFFVFFFRCDEFFFFFAKERNDRIFASNSKKKIVRRKAKKPEEDKTTEKRAISLVYTHTHTQIHTRK
jgi:hypothetical protein